MPYLQHFKAAQAGRGRAPKPRFSRRFLGALERKGASVPTPLRLSSSTAASGSFAIPSPPTSLFLARRFCFSPSLSPQTAARLPVGLPFPEASFCLPFGSYFKQRRKDAFACLALSLPALETTRRERVVEGGGIFCALIARAEFLGDLPETFPLLRRSSFDSMCAPSLSGALAASGGIRTALVGEKNGGRH